VPKPADASHWKADRALLRSEHVLIVEAVRAFDPRRLDKTAPGSANYRFVDLLFGVVEALVPDPARTASIAGFLHEVQS
jgi:hypothetical protein